ncbi:uncharacterized protein LOC131207932 [Anopheles bellator]|uniref:uncharacterized protein LOC131207932 n=1 Tax=Anopheles bellator TaxID=139047 RepID=UPI0026480809|nr:uncharacterized protein LOC131207932 [Anopheles bellator]
MASKTSNINISQVIPKNEQIIERNLIWRRLFEKFSDITLDEEDPGMAASELTNAAQNQASTEQADESNASDVEEVEEADCNSSYDTKDADKQLAVALKKRRTEWKRNGLDKVLQDNHFDHLNSADMMNWLNDCVAGQSKVMNRVKETRFTHHDGDNTMDASCANNVSVLNSASKQMVSTMKNSNYRFTHGPKKKIVVHEMVKSTFTTLYSEDCAELERMFGFDFGHSLIREPKPSKQVTFGTIGKLANPQIKDPYEVQCQQARKLRVRNIAPINKSGKNESTNKLTNLMQADNSSSEDKENCSDSDESSPRKPINRVVKAAAHKQASYNKVALKKSHKTTASGNKTISATSMKATKEPAHGRDDADSDSDHVLASLKKKSNRRQRARKVKVKMLSSSSDSERDTKTTVNHTDLGKAIPVTDDRKNGSKSSVAPPQDCNGKAVCSEMPHYELPVPNGQPKRGIVIYRPKQVQHGLLPTAQMQLASKNLDLTGIGSETKRKKFDNFSRIIHPNSTIVYYISESEDESDSEDDSLDDEDLLKTFRPLHLVEYRYCKDKMGP